MSTLGTKLRTHVERVGTMDGRGSGRVTIVSMAVEKIREAVMHGRYASNQRLVEADLMRELGISRGAVREALGRLAAEGLIVLEPHRSAIVRPLTREGLKSRSQIREALEGLAARLAAERLRDDPAQAEKVRKHLISLAKGGEREPEAYMENNFHFHNTIIELSTNVDLGRVLLQLGSSNVTAHFPLLLDAKLIQRSIKEHLNVVDAVCTGDARRAETLMRSHVRRTGRLSLNLPEYLFAKTER